MKIDAHQHFWQFDPIRDAWIDDSMNVLRRDFLPLELGEILQNHDIDGCVAVQADQSETETSFLLNLAENYSFIKGVVGWVDLLASDLSDRLAFFSINPLFKGVRHIAQAEEDDFLKREDIKLGISHLRKYNLTYDILIYPRQLPAAIELVKAIPEQRFALDHIAKPDISSGLSASWKSDIGELSSLSNVYCKISGLVTETKGYHWKEKEFVPFLDTIVDSFGVDRIMYGSDWPVCILAANYSGQLDILSDYMAQYSIEDQEKFWGLNAQHFYNLNDEIV